MPRVIIQISFPLPGFPWAWRADIRLIPHEDTHDLEDAQHETLLNLTFIFALSFCLVCLIHLLQSRVSHNIRPTADYVYTKTDIVKHTGKNEDSSFWT